MSGEEYKAMPVKPDHITITSPSIATMTPIYILELSNNKYYVGISKQPVLRIKQHLNGCGSAWTKLYKPTGRYRIIRTGDNPYNLAVVTETTVTYHLMLRFGYQNVRGAGWTLTSNYSKPPQPPKNYQPLS